MTYWPVWLAISMFLAFRYVPGTAGEVESLRAQFDRCAHHDGPAHIHPMEPEEDPEVSFFFLADIDKCETEPLTAVQHVVKNLHPTNWLNFIWAPLDNSALLAPGEVYKNIMLLEGYNGHLHPGVIKYGANLRSEYAPQVSASFYPLTQRADVTLDEPTVIANIIEIGEFSPTEIGRISVEITSTYDSSKQFTIYSFERDHGVVVALGNISSRAIGQGIAETLPSSIAELAKLMDIKHLEQMSESFQKGEFVILSPDEDTSKKLLLEGAIDNFIISPVAILTDTFEPIATASVILLSP